MKQRQHNKKMRIAVKRMLKDCGIGVDMAEINKDRTILFTINGHKSNITLIDSYGKRASEDAKKSNNYSGKDLNSLSLSAN